MAFVPSTCDYQPATSPFRMVSRPAMEWATANPVLGLGECAHETDTGRFKVGDGKTPYKNLAYQMSIGVPGEPGPQGVAGPFGPPGPRGERGEQGSVGAAGPATVLSIGTVASGPITSVTLTGEAPSQKLNFVIPRGDTGLPGATNSLKIGTVVAGVNAAATITGNAPDQTISLVLPRGEKGEAGSPGSQGIKGDKGDTGPKGDIGASAVIKGTASSFPPVPTPAVNDLYILGTTGSLTGAPSSSIGPASVGDGVLWTGSSWVNVGPLRGPAGVQGDVGPTGPVGLPGPPTTLAIGTVSSGPIAQAALTGISPNQTLSLVLPKGDTGSQGVKGDVGPVGPAGPPNTLTVGTVTSGTAGSDPLVTLTGVAPAQTISFRFPAPAEPAVNSLTIGTITTGAASATITGTPPNQVLNLVLPNPQVTQTTSFTLNPVATAAFAGEQATFTANAQSTEGPIVFKWQVSTDNGATFTDIAGAGTNTYTFTPVLADNGKRYRCVAGTPTLGQTNSLIAALTVTNRPIPDGSSWIAGGSTGSSQGINFSNGLFITGSGAWSVDGAAWTPSGVAIASRPVFGNGTWVAASSLTAITNPYFTSSDGKNWVSRTRPFANTNDTGGVTFGFGFGRFVAFWSTTTNYYVGTALTAVRVIRAAHSTDGINWTACPAITGMITASNPANTSTTGFTAAQVAATFSSITSVATGSGNSPLMVATGLIPAGATNQYLASADGITWVLKTFPAAIVAQGVAFGGTNFAVVGTGNVAFYTPTPAAALTTATIAFAQTTMPTSASWSAVTYGNGKFVAVASTSSTAANSANGITWAQQSLPSSSSWNGVAFGNNSFIAIGAGTAISS